MEEEGIRINKETMDVLVTNVIPTTKYFESRFDHMQYQIDEIKNNQISMIESIDKKFENMQKSVDERFKQVDERFKQVDARLDKVDLRLDNIEKSIHNIEIKIEQLIKSQETTIRDYIIERDRFYDNKFNNLRMFNIATISLMAGILLKMVGVITI